MSHSNFYAAHAGKSNYAFNPIAEQASRSNQIFVPQRVNAALGVHGRLAVRTSGHFLLMSCVIIFILGVAHLMLTFRGSKLWPKNDGLKLEMEQVSPRITMETTMWKAWIGFNVSHSMGAIFFGLIFGHIALTAPEMFAASKFQQITGLAFLLGYCFLGWKFWFSTPFRGIVLATGAYCASLYGVYA